MIRQLKLRERCPLCSSPSPERHPAVQWEGEVQICADAFHQIVTPSNSPEKIAKVQAMLAQEGLA